MSSPPLPGERARGAQENLCADLASYLLTEPPKQGATCHVMCRHLYSPDPPKSGREPKSSAESTVTLGKDKTPAVRYGETNLKTLHRLRATVFESLGYGPLKLFVSKAAVAVERTQCGAPALAYSKRVPRVDRQSLVVESHYCKRGGIG